MINIFDLVKKEKDKWWLNHKHKSPTQAFASPEIFQEMVDAASVLSEKSVVEAIVEGRGSFFGLLWKPVHGQKILKLK